MSETLNSDVVFKNLENILNYSSSVIMKEAIEVLWLKKTSDFDATGFAKIGKRIVRIDATFDGVDLAVWVWIGKNALKFEFSNEEIAKVIELVKQWGVQQ